MAESQNVWFTVSYLMWCGLFNTGVIRQILWLNAHALNVVSDGRVTPFQMACLRFKWKEIPNPSLVWTCWQFCLSWKCQHPSCGTNDSVTQETCKHVFIVYNAITFVACIWRLGSSDFLVQSCEGMLLSGCWIMQRASSKGPFVWPYLTCLSCIHMAWRHTWCMEQDLHSYY